MFFGRNKKTRIKDKIANDKNIQFILKDAFEDENLAALIANELGYSSSKVKVSLDELDQITFLSGENKNIKSLNGLEYLNNLRIADFSNNNIEELPDFSESNNNLYNIKNTLLIMDLSGNPFLDPNNLFSLDSVQSRNSFIKQFKDYYSRFKTGDVSERIFSDEEINPREIQLIFDYLIPENIENREKLFNDLFIKYLIGRKIFLGKDFNRSRYLIDNGYLKVMDTDLNPSFLDELGLNLFSQNYESIVPEKDLYLIRSLVNNLEKIPETQKDFKSIYNYYLSEPDKLSTDFINNGNDWVQRSAYSELKNVLTSNEDELILNQIQNDQVKALFNKYLEYRNIIQKYKNEHPDREVEVQKILLKNDSTIKNFLNQYLTLEKNPLLSDKQKVTINNASNSIEKFVNNYVEQAHQLFEQDVFGLEVEMKYIDMLTEADRKFN